MDQENELSLGEYLTKAREEANFSIEKLSLKTRINANVLRSLEAEDYSSLPSPAYLKGFLLNYVRMFSLDENVAIKKLEESYFSKTGQKFPSLNHTKAQKNSFKAKDQDAEEILNKSENIIDTTKSFMPLIIGAVVIAASFGGYKFVSNMINQEVESRKGIDQIEEDYTDESSETTVSEQAPEETSDIQPQEVKEVPKVEEAPAAPVEPAAPSKPVTPPTPPAPEVKPEPKKAETKKTREPKRMFPTIEFKSIPTNLYTLKPTAPENKDETLMPSTYKAKMNPELQNLYVHAKDGETWVNYKVDEEPIQNEFIRQGKALFLQGKEIRMFFGNVNVTRIFLNNTFIDASSPTGVKTVIFPQSEASKYKRPLFPRAANGELYTSDEYIEKMNEEEQKTGNH